MNMSYDEERKGYDGVYNHGNIFNKLQEESRNRGFSTNVQYVRNNNYINDADDDRMTTNTNISVGKVLVGLTVIGGVTWLVNKYIVKPIRRNVEEVINQFVNKPINDSPILDGKVKVVSELERHLIDLKSQTLSEDEYEILPDD